MSARFRTKSVAIFLSVLLIGFAASLNKVQSTSPAGSDAFTLPCQINTYGNAWNGTLWYGLFEYNPQNLSQDLDQRLVYMTTDGNVLYLQDQADCGWAVKYISKDTLMYQGSNAHFLDFATGAITDYPIQGHHDMEYDLVTNTFLTLDNYVRTINGTRILFDKIVEFNSTGGVLWTWDTYDHLSLSEACVYNDTATYNDETVMDFTHCNDIQWDYNQSVVYLNIRHLNTFYKINMTTNDIIWACGEHGNFTLQDPEGKQVSSLWYHSHATEEVEPDVFMMFDNDYHNETDANDGHSRILEITLNESSMTAKETWSWIAPKDYWSPYWGKVDRLPNGDRIGTFGTQTKLYNSSIGAVIVEVNEAGEVVRTWTFPVGWGIYRVTLGEEETSIGGFDMRIVIIGVSVGAMILIVAASIFFVRRRSPGRIVKQKGQSNS